MTSHSPPLNTTGYSPEDTKHDLTLSPLNTAGYSPEVTKHDLTLSPFLATRLAARRSTQVTGHDHTPLRPPASRL